MTIEASSGNPVAMKQNERNLTKNLLKININDLWFVFHFHHYLQICIAVAGAKVAIPTYITWERINKKSPVIIVGRKSNLFAKYCKKIASFRASK